MSTLRTPQELVLEFHQAFGIAIGEYDTTPLRALRAKLLLEESSEAYDEIVSGDLRAIAKELADTAIVLYGAAISLGIDLDEAVRAVHASNMTKLGDDGRPILRADGKVLKGPNYQEADVSASLPDWGSG